MFILFVRSSSYGLRSKHLRPFLTAYGLNTDGLSSSQVVAPRIELGTTSISARSGQPALDYRVSLSSVANSL